MQEVVHSAKKIVNILLVDDDDDDVDVACLRRSFKKSGVTNPVYVAHNGLDALEKLRGGVEGPALPRPLMIVLDINMPRMNGHEFLKELRADPTLRDLVVFMLTTSNDSSDKKLAYSHQVAGYVLKESAGGQFCGLTDLLKKYWQVVQLGE